MILDDTKDWTWVLDKSCPQCGFDASACRAVEVAQLLRDNVDAWEQFASSAAIRAGRPNASTWSSLEYACHVRDMFQRFRIRIALMIDEDNPLFENWDQDATAVTDRYEEQSPSAVIAELASAGESLAQQLEHVQENEWQRPGRRSDGASFTVESIARYMIHDPVHHVWDVAAQIE